MGGQIVVRQRIHLILGVAAHGAGGAAALLYGVLLCNVAEVKYALLTAHGCHMDLTGGLLASVHGAVGSLAPHNAGAALPAVLHRGGIFRPALGNGRHVVVVVTANQLLNHVVAQQTNFHGAGNLHRTGAAGDQRLQLLRAQHSAHAAAAGVAHGGDHAAHGHQIFTGLTDGHHVEGVAVFLGQRGVGLKGALAPHMGSVLDGHVVIVDLEVHGLVALSLDDHRVIAGILQRMGEVTADVRVHDGVALGPVAQEGDVHTAGAGHAGGGQRANAEHGLCRRTQRIAVQRNLVPDNLIAKTHAADIRLILGQGIFFCDGAGGQVDAQYSTGPAVDAILNGHVVTLLLVSNLSRSRTQASRPHVKRFKQRGFSISAHDHHPALGVSATKPSAGLRSGNPALPGSRVVDFAKQNQFLAR